MYKNNKTYNFNLFGGGINNKIFNKIKNELQNKMIIDLPILKTRTEFKNEESINDFFDDIEKKIQDKGKGKDKDKGKQKGKRGQFKDKNEKAKFDDDVKNANNIDDIITLYHDKGFIFDIKIFKYNIEIEKKSVDESMAIAMGFNIVVKKSFNNVPSFINDIISDVDIQIWIILQYIKNLIQIEEFFDNTLKQNIEDYLKLKGKIKDTKTLKLNKLKKTNKVINEEDKLVKKDEPSYIFKSIILNNNFNYIDDNNYNALKSYIIITPVYESDILSIYNPETLRHSIQLGKGTKWCTAVKGKNNEFNNYIKDGPLYIVIIKKINNEKIEELKLHKEFYNHNKFQFHEKKKSNMNPNDIKIDILYFYYLYPEVNEYFNIENVNLIDEKLNITDKNYKILKFIQSKNDLSFITELIFNVSIYNNTISFLKLPNLKKFYYNSISNSTIDLLDFLKTFENLQEFYCNCNLKFKDSLMFLKKLEILHIHDCNKLSLNSLDNLINLKELKIIYTSKPLNNLLDKLFNLESLTLNFISKPLGNSLDKLTNLKELYFGNYNYLLENEFDNLINLKKIHFNFNFNKLLGKSLNNLINLTTLTFGINFNQPLNNSLHKLINLTNLTFDENFNQPLDNSLHELINLTTLTFGKNFNQPLDNSLHELIKLTTLTFGNNFNKPLDNSLNKLINLTTLTFGNDFNQPLDNSLNELINLTTLNFGYNFYQSLSNSFKNKKLKNLILPIYYKIPIVVFNTNESNLKNIKCNIDLIYINDEFYNVNNLITFISLN